METLPAARLATTRLAARPHRPTCSRKNALERQGGLLPSVLLDAGSGRNKLPLALSVTDRPRCIETLDDFPEIPGTVRTTCALQISAGFFHRATSSDGAHATDITAQATMTLK